MQSTDYVSVYLVKESTYYYLIYEKFKADGIELALRDYIFLDDIFSISEKGSYYLLIFPTEISFAIVRVSITIAYGAFVFFSDTLTLTVSTAVTCFSFFIFFILVQPLASRRAKLKNPKNIVTLGELVREFRMIFKERKQIEKIWIQRS